jgi:hypothetical protein
MYARTNRCYNERGSRINYVRSSIPHCILYNYKRSLSDGLSHNVLKKHAEENVSAFIKTSTWYKLCWTAFLRLVCGCYGKECTLILRAKRRRQLPQSAGRDRLHLFQQQKYLSGYCTRKCRSLVVLSMKCGNGLDIQHESGMRARTVLSGNLIGKRSCIAEEKPCTYCWTFCILCPQMILF